MGGKQRRREEVYLARVHLTGVQQPLQLVLLYLVQDGCTIIQVGHSSLHLFVVHETHIKTMRTSRHLLVILFHQSPSYLVGNLFCTP